MPSPHRQRKGPTRAALRGALANELLAREGRDSVLKALEELLAADGPAAPRREPWDLTMPAPLSSRPLAQPFDEPLDGMAVREVREPSIFRRFFGRR